MLFNSLGFFIFFPLVAVFYFLLPYKYRWILLLAASYYFYMCWKASYVLLIGFSTLVAYYTALKMENLEDEKKKRPFMLISVFFNLGLLFLFKYFNFFNQEVRELLGNFNLFISEPTLKLLLPVGISFYTFQVLSYSVDVYQGKKSAEKHLGIFALYVSFFPQLVAGPIERSATLLPQFYKKFDFNYDRVVSGLRLMLWGFFKKMVVADRLAAYVNIVYADATEYSGLVFIWASLFFAFQIYCDFSAYSDIAIGAARVMGFDLMQNFNIPYISKNMTEFWRRWHISLSTWIRDYLYTPIATRRRFWGKWGVAYALIVAFTLNGFWHGANWSFLLWGFLHSLVLVYEIFTRKRRKRLSKKIPSWIYNNVSILITFAFWCFSLIFFRANSISESFHVIKTLPSIDLSSVIGLPGFTPQAFVINFVVIGIIIMSDIMINRNLHRRLLANRWASYMINFIIILSIIAFGIFEEQQFIYFQF